MKALPIEVFKNSTIGDCSNGGITGKYDTLLLVCDDGFIDIDENNLPGNLVKVVTRQLFGKEHKHIEPFNKPKRLGWMFGGAIGYTSDSRFDNQYPLKIHDRQETQKEYDMLSR